MSFVYILRAWVEGLTPHITGKIKLQIEAAQLYFVRVHVLVRRH